MRDSSLSRRLFLAAMVLIIALTVAAGLILSKLYRNAVIQGFDRRLNVHLQALVADMAAGGLAAAGSDELGEPLFNIPLSGWYWQITPQPPAKTEPKTSRSLFDATLQNLADLGVQERLGAREGYLDGPDNQRLRVLERTIDLGEDGRYLIAVAGDTAEPKAEIRDFNLVLLTVLGALGLGLIATTAFQVLFGLKPLARIRDGLIAIRAGKAERLDGVFPREVAPLVRETNALLESNREIVERARTHVGNLAHALKTPLSVIINEVDAPGGANPTKLREQAEIMREQISHHLRRAQQAARAQVAAAAVPLAPVVEAIARTMLKVHRGRDLEILPDIPPDLQFRGERQDLEEMIGNLVDNACKWARGTVTVQASGGDRASAADRGAFRLIVEDDGPGLPKEALAHIGARGVRLDESKPGTGLGLAIVRDLAATYGGRLDLAESPKGGLRCVLELPAA